MRRIITGTIITAALLYATQITCPVDGAGSYFTGETKNDVSGHLLKKYQCERFREHVFWVASR